MLHYEPLKTSQPPTLVNDYGRSQGTGLADALTAAATEEHGADPVAFNRHHFPMVFRMTVPYESVIDNALKVVV